MGKVKHFFDALSQYVSSDLPFLKLDVHKDYMDI